MVTDGVACNRRVGKLYRLPGSEAFGCRRCHRLTYRSAQENHRWAGLAAVVARGIPGAKPAVVQRMLTRRAVG